MSGILKGASEAPAIYYLPDCPREVYSTLDKGLTNWCANPLRATKVELLKSIFNICMNYPPSSDSDLDPRLWRRYCKLEYRLKSIYNNTLDVDKLLREIFYEQKYPTNNLEKNGKVCYTLLFLKKLPTRDKRIYVDIALNLRNLKLCVVHRIIPTAHHELKTARLWNGRFHQALAVEPHVVPILDVFENKIGCSSLQIFKYYDVGDLSDWFNKVNGKMPKEVRWRIMEAIYVQTGRLSKSKIFHRDIKPENILLKHSRKAGFRLAFTDFEFAVSPQKSLNMYNGLQGTLTRLSPEILEQCIHPSVNKEEYLASTDSWAVGTVLTQLWQPYMPKEVVHWLIVNIKVLETVRNIEVDREKIREVKESYSSTQQYDEFILACKTDAERLIVELFNPNFEKRLTLEKAAERFEILDFAAQ